MLRKIISLVLSLWILFGCSARTEPSSAKQTINDFYKSYLNYRSESGRPVPELKYSQAMLAAMKRNNEICLKYATEICGWNAEGNEYLDSQESDPDLSYENSRIEVNEISPGTIQVKLNVYPSEKSAGNFYDRTLVFKMVQEDGNWVTDDILSGTPLSSTRDYIEYENDYYIKTPDPDSAGAKELDRSIVP